MPRGRKPKDPNAVKTTVKTTVKKPRTNTNRDVGDPTFDMLKVFEGKSIGDMDDVQLEECVTRLQQLRLMRFTTAKRKTPLDVMLAGLNEEKARLYLAVLDKDKNNDKIDEKELE